MSEILGYIGSKKDLMNDIMNIINMFDDVDVIVDVFGGSGTVLLNLPDVSLKHKYRKIYNDIDNNLVNLFEVLRDDESRNKLLSMFDYYVHSRYLYEEFYKNPKGKDRIDWAFRTLYIYHNSVANDIHAHNFFVPLDDVRTINVDTIRFLSNKIKRWTIENKDFEKLISDYDRSNVLFYLDPPYVGLNYYRYNFNEYDFVRMERVLRNIKGHYIMNINDGDIVRSIFGEPQMIKTYKNRVGDVRSDTRNDRVELFYYK